MLHGLVLFAAALSQEFTGATYEKTRDAIALSKDERAFWELPWQPTLWDGLVKAQREEKPILMYAMNGNPLGCT
jgi:hypothetical protein